ncbi:hypothetical protein DSO57_1029719 [Entomophthora muscae]|uniref:Uncharacterized protein n=1 Tax=Entomophthora muscae TaxID=34485 RepID=A0ACC2TN59_9FUNG|nr:hypothetical protein DSO57_1029719 [Entomophthora muscae]
MASARYNLGYTFVVTATIQMTFFLVAYFLQFDKLTDFTGTTNFILLALLTFPYGEYSSRQALMTLAVVAWGIRIAGYLLYRILKTEKDDRFDKIRGNFFRFLRFWIMQMLWVWLVSLPLTLVNSSIEGQEESFGRATDKLGLAMAIFGLAVETVADFQKFRASTDRNNKLFYMTSGLWYYSRHPNYFGEITFWWGIFLSSLGSFPNSILLLGLLSPLVTMGLLLFLSGIPLSERQKEQAINNSNDEAAQKKYYRYIQTTSPLIPLFPSWYLPLPDTIKRNLFLEFPLYRYQFSSGTSPETKKAN